MPDFLPEAVQASCETLRRLIEEPLRRLEAGLSDDWSLPVPPAVAAEVRVASRAAGLFGKTQPVEFGGTSAGVLELTALREQLAAADLRLARFVFGPAPGLLRHAEGALRNDYLQPLLLGDKQGAFGFTEPADAVQPTRAVLDGDELVIDGRKSWVTGGATADFVCVLANVQRADGEKLGTAMVVVDRQQSGVHIERSFRSLEGGGHVAMRLDGVRVPASRVIGRIGEGMPRALDNIGEIRLALSAAAMGMCRWVMALVESHLTAEHRRGAPLGEREGVRLRYADLRIETYAARAMLYRTARLLDAGDDRSVNEVMATKVFCTEVAGRVVDGAVQLCGGQALIEGHPLERVYRAVRSMRLAEGASDVLRLNIARGRLEYEAGRL